MQKTRLFTPGPTPVLPAVLEAMSKPILHHRSKAFVEILEDVRQGLKDLFETTQEVLIFSSSGTGAMEGVISNLCSAKDKVLVVRAGKFGERWGEIAEAYGLSPVYLDIEWGQAPTVLQIQELLKSNPDAKALFIQACETSTGVNFPVEEIAKLTQNISTLLVVDAISYLGVSPFKMDTWGVDVVVTGSQKGLMIPPGLGFACLNDRAWELQKSSTLPKYYFNLAKEHKSILKNQTAYTSSVSLIVGLAEVLRHFKKEGKQNIFNAYKASSTAMREAVTAMELELFAKSPSDGLVSICVPENIDGKKIISLLRDKHHMTIAGGQAHLSGKIIRISCMGYIDSQDLISVFSALESVLKSLGAKIPYGKGVAKLQQHLLQPQGKK